MKHFPSDDREPRDDEIEFSDLPAEPSPSRQATLTESKATRISLHTHLSPQQRRHRLLITASTVVLATIVFLASIAPVRALLVTALFPASSKTAHPAPLMVPKSGASLVYLQVLPKWGRVLVDGHVLSPIPVASLVIPGQIPPLQLARGVHTLQWQAEPFNSVRCVLVVPLPSKGSTCQVAQSRQNQFTDQAWLVSLPVSLADLPMSSRATLLQDAQNLLTTFQKTETVQTGERYVVVVTQAQQPSMQVARQPLLATLSFELETTTGQPAICDGVSLSTQPFSCAIGGQDCRLFCTLFWPGATSGWDVAAIIRPEWSYKTLNGQIIAQHQPDTLIAQGQFQFITLHIVWHGHWQVTFHPTGESTFDDPACIAAESDVFTNPVLDEAGHTDLFWNFLSDSDSATGCVADGTISVPSQLLGGTPASVEHVYLLHRFGVLLAANALAHRTWPQLPVASTQEQNIASQILSK